LLVNGDGEELLSFLAKELPRFLREHPEARYELMGLVAEVFARRDEFQEILSLLREVIQRQEEHSHVPRNHSFVLEEHTSAIRRLMEQQQRLMEEVVRMGRTLSAVGARWGYLAEEAFREGLVAIVKEQLGWKVEKWRHWDEEGFVFGHPDWVEADVAIHDGKHILIQVVASATRGGHHCVLSDRATL